VAVRRTVSVLAALALIAGLAYYAGRRWDPPALSTLLSGECVVDAEDERVRLDPEQMANAATVTAVGVRMGMPDRAVVVALATAFQESKLRNLPHLGLRNDHDSLGLFQQRPSQGWGTEEQVRDPRYAAERFYQALREVPGWQEMRVTDAAQRVQRSAFPEAYQQWADDASVLATALLGRAGGAVSCQFQELPAVPVGDVVGALWEHLRDDWGTAPEALVDETGLSVIADGPVAGWRYAHWLVSHAGSFGVATVHFDDLVWSTSSGGWEQAGEARDDVRAEVAARP
jgi:hypothetical protein